MTNLLLVIALVSALPAASGFAGNHYLMRPMSSTSHASRKPQSRLAEKSNAADEPTPSSNLSRREAIGRTVVAVAASAALSSAIPTVARADIEGVVSMPRNTDPPEAKPSNVEGVTVFKTKSGLQYIDIEEGTGPSPKYGNLVGISYKAYIKLPDIQGVSSKLDEFDSDGGYLVKHGNGRTVPGLDEGLHTMKIGGRRRIIVPPKLGYVSSGLGPIPVGPYGRWKLNRLIDRMVEVKGGNVIFDVEMRSILEDEADQGYYDDESLTPDEFNTLRQNIEASQQDAAAKGATVL